MTKQEAIKNAYGDAWEKVAEYVDDNGWIGRDSVCPSDFNFGYPDDDIHIKTPAFERDYFWRPKALSGIEDNNGWIKIEDREPEDGLDIEYCYFGSPQVGSQKFLPDSIDTYAITHWKPYVEPKPPLY